MHFLKRRLHEKIYYKNYKNFGKSSFLLDLKSTNLDSSSFDLDENHIFLTNQFLKVVNQQSPLKVKILRENHALFVNKQLRKEIYKISKLRNNTAKILPNKMKPYKGNKKNRGPLRRSCERLFH